MESPLSEIINETADIAKLAEMFDYVSEIDFEFDDEF